MKGFTNNQSISRISNQLIRYYQIPFTISKEKALDAVLNTINEKEIFLNRRKRIFRQIARVASTAAVVILAVSFWFFSASEKITTSPGEIISYRLPDQSRIVLHESSSLKFRKYSWKGKVKLHGEAYFEVEKGERFQVVTKLGKVEVLGTRFLVSEQGNQFSVKCYEGKVMTRYNNNSLLIESGIEFNGEKRKLQKRYIEKSAQFPEFAKFEKDFLNEDLKKVVSEVEEFFNVEIAIKAGGNKKFTGKIKTGNLKSTMEIICTSLELEYRFSDLNKLEIINK